LAQKIFSGKISEKPGRKNNFLKKISLHNFSEISGRRKKIFLKKFFWHKFLKN